MRINHRILAAAAVVALSAGAAHADKGNASGNDLWVQPSGNGYTVEYVSDGQVVGLQFDVKGIKVAEGQFQCGTSVAESHIANCTINDEGNLRVIVFSMENAPLPDGTLVTITAPSRDQSKRMELRQASADAAPAAQLAGVVLADAQGVDITPDHLK
ncbi:hypothetical protein HFP89_02930 [Wenzhouxiangella sp. XN79A]|uniref:hypothetical protein n=1 Tax=Wenzhouxiangella sp. XN79A TaxID=2724193 RepID=UPI00144A54FB|nr:hypothetical protein [Wenzhouxiangella sp. XN79A]NKI34119.1 hypothetical protein [Wenzhouxiangella sp. XN79A]